VCKEKRITPYAMESIELGHHLRSIKHTEKPKLSFPLTQHCLQAHTQPSSTSELCTHRAWHLHQAKVEGTSTHEIYWKGYSHLSGGWETWGSRGMLVWWLQLVHHPLRPPLTLSPVAF